MPTITLHPSQVFEADSNFKSVDAAHPFDEALGEAKTARLMPSGTWLTASQL